VHVSRIGPYVLWTAPHVDLNDPFESLRAVTLGDVEGRELPIVREAAQRILNVGGKLDQRDGRLVIRIPEKLAPSNRVDSDLRAPLLDAARVLIAAGEVVVGAASSSSRKPLADRLPDHHVAIRGGLVP
jgi:hypothetical protein